MGIFQIIWKLSLRIHSYAALICKNEDNGRTGDTAITGKAVEV